MGRILLTLASLVSSLTFVVATPAQAAIDWDTVDGGKQHSCGIRAGKLYCWGDNGARQLGYGDYDTERSTPVLITRATDWTTVTAGESHTCAIRSTGKLYCWGSDVDGKVGDGGTNDRPPTPIQITRATDWKTVSAGNFHTCAIRSTGKLYCWGNDDGNQLGDGEGDGGVDKPAPVQITRAIDWKTVSVGNLHTCAIRSIGKLYCWGSDSNGQLGDWIPLASKSNPGPDHESK